MTFTDNGKPGKTAEWGTPQAVFDKLDAEFHFTLDPCAASWNAKCKKFFTKEQDGLKQDWSYDNVFMNPPYGREIAKWVKKARDEAKQGALVVCLLPANVDTAWFHDYIYDQAEIRFPRGRINFVAEDGKQHAGSNHASMFVIFKPEGFNDDRF